MLADIQMPIAIISFEVSRDLYHIVFAQIELALLVHLPYDRINPVEDPFCLWVSSQPRDLGFECPLYNSRPFTGSRGTDSTTPTSLVFGQLHNDFAFISSESILGATGHPNEVVLWDVFHIGVEV